MMGEPVHATTPRFLVLPYESHQAGRQGYPLVAGGTTWQGRYRS
jgi:hypothetical protein